MSRIYVASSWRNARQPSVVEALRTAGHEVYDFRNPPHGRGGFAWSDIDPAWQSWTPEQFRKALNHPLAVDGFGSDHGAMEWADACVCVLPCGRSAHLELGWFAGAGKTAILLVEQAQEPELMYLEGSVCTTLDEVLVELAIAEETAPPREASSPWAVLGVLRQFVPASQLPDELGDATMTVCRRLQARGDRALNLSERMIADVRARHHDVRNALTVFSLHDDPEVREAAVRVLALLSPTREE